ncbi:MAG: hypothetical protein JW982_06680 [Spirochaetes bacterium]|nr:hypothetical protein [Spirochaetota bacterium]
MKRVLTFLTLMFLPLVSLYSDDLNIVIPIEEVISSSTAVFAAGPLNDEARIIKKKAGIFRFYNYEIRDLKS